MPSSNLYHKFHNTFSQYCYNCNQDMLHPDSAILQVTAPEIRLQLYLCPDCATSFVTKCTAFKQSFVHATLTLPTGVIIIHPVTVIAVMIKPPSEYVPSKGS